MLIFDKNAKLIVCSNDEDLLDLGIDSAFDFFKSGRDIASLFIQKPGYISNHGDLAWIDFIFNEVFENNRVLCEVDGEQKAVAITRIPIMTETDMHLTALEFSARPQSGETARDREDKQSAAPAHDSSGEPEEDPRPKHEPGQSSDSDNDDDELMELLNLNEQNEDEDTDTQDKDDAPADEQEDADDEYELDLDFGDESQDDEQPDTQEQNTQDESEETDSQKSEDDELMELLNLNEDEKPQESPEPQEETAQQEQDDQDDDEELYNLDLDPDTKDASDTEEPPAQEQDEQDEQEELMDLGLDDEQMQISPPEQPEPEQSGGQSVPQYIDDKDDSSEVELDTLADELGLEKEETANFIDDFANMVKAKEDLLYGDNAAVEAASLKNIAENFRLHNITKTLETIEAGENNAALLFSQIAKLQNQLKEYVTTVEPAATNPQSDTDYEPSGALQWEEARITPVEFDPSVAADSLGLPNELISEFVDDFIEQALENKEVFEKAYDQQDIKTIQQTAHKLKGAASNLRIDAMADKLEQLQHNDDFDNVKPLLLEYWGMYLGLKEVLQ
ncbi:MAG: Hpt domain-containing protein [Campylobacterota bacterium]